MLIFPKYETRTSVNEKRGHAFKDSLESLLSTHGVSGFAHLQDETIENPVS